MPKPTKWWLVIRWSPTGEAIGIAEYTELESYGPGTGYISMVDHWLRTKHTRLCEQLGTHWMYEVISQAEFETYRDLAGLEILGEEK